MAIMHNPSTLSYWRDRLATFGLYGNVCTERNAEIYATGVQYFSF